MSRYVGPIRRLKAGRTGHWYRDANGQRVPSVTDILKGLPKDALINWSANATADYAINNWDELAELKPAARLERLKKGRYQDRDTAANRGNEVHRFAERYISGEEALVPPEIAGHVDSYVQWVDDWKPEPLLVEAVVMSHRHGYAGTLDLAVEIDDPEVLALLAHQLDQPELAHLDRPARGIGDVKTNRSGIFAETALQVAAYRHADVYLDDDGAEQPMPAFDFAFALHVRGDGYGMRPLVAGPEQLREFLYVREVRRFDQDTGATYIGDELTPRSRLERRRLELVADPPATTRRRTEGAAS